MLFRVELILNLYLIFTYFTFIIGKSKLSEFIAKYATTNGFKFFISAPTEKLAARYARKFSDIKCNTVNINFFISVGNQEENGINWSLSDVQILIVDKVFTYYYCLIFFNVKKFIDTCTKSNTFFTIFHYHLRHSVLK